MAKRKPKKFSTVDSPETPEIETQEAPRRSPFTKRAIVYGLIVGSIYVFLAIYTSLKTGVTFVAGVILVGYILLSIRNKYDPQENVVVSSIAEGSILVGAGVIASLPAIVIFSPRISEKGLDWILLFFK
ncbi:MAG: OPT/YSL family transporter, partial [Candidatus Jordarchaeaceae archaeon]